ncbi:MAG: hypothetical protein JW801_19445 [Bacteroidales bacterium]|nr:hypothetical protein [Bacteroidales bacterium]
MLLFHPGTYGQSGSAREGEVDSLLNVHLQSIPALEEKVNISVSGVALEEFLRGIANSAGLNLDIEPGLNYSVVNNFQDVRVYDVLIYVCRQYKLDLHITGSIISIYKPDPLDTRDNKSVSWEESSNLITLDFRSTPIGQAVKEITQKTNINLIYTPSAEGKFLTVYIKDRPINSAIEKLAYSNGLKLNITEDNFYVLEAEASKKEEQVVSASQRSSSRSSRTTDEESYKLEVQQVRDGNLNIFAENAPIQEVLKEISQKTGFNYMLTAEAEATVSVNMKNITPQKILDNILKGSKLSYRQNDDLFLIGGIDQMDFRDNRVIILQNRSIEKIVEYLPEVLKKNLTMVEFPETNSLFVSGPGYQIEQLEQFIREIDKVVPVILIEVIIMYVNKSFTISTGIDAGIGDGPADAGGALFPSIDFNLNANEINRILNGINIGYVNLGRVTPNFYLSLKALEEQGYLELESTPKLATLNGHEATLAIGNTEYYLEEQTTLFGTQNPQQTSTQEYKAINAELSIKIKPVVSANNQITLEIEVHQSDFTERISATAPPGSVNRDFTSQIRIKDQEMILLGGLMEQRRSNSGSGTPLLSRIPILKWFFSSRKLETSDSKLSVLIKPTIIN